MTIQTDGGSEQPILHPKLKGIMQSKLFSQVNIPVLIESTSTSKMSLVNSFLRDFTMPATLEIPTWNYSAASMTRDVILQLITQSEVKSVYYDNNNIGFGLIDTAFPMLGELRPYILTGKQIRPLPAGTVPITKIRELVGSDVAESEGFQGDGVKVAVIDTGCFFFQPMIRGAKLESRRVNLFDVADSSGHGTWCTTAIAGQEVTAPLTNVKCKGISPGVNVCAIKALATPIGYGNDSAVIKAYELAMQWGAKIISMSLGSEGYNPQNAHEKPIADLVSKGMIFAVAAGNSGPASGSIGTPAGSNNVITVGSVNTINNAPSGFSSRGPTPNTDTIKPDVASYGGDNKTTPLENIFCGVSPGSYIDMNDKIVTGFAGTMGTSMATPAFAGTLALWVEYLRKKRNIEPTTTDILNILKLNNTTGKSNSIGYGIAKYDWVKKF